MDESRPDSWIGEVHRICQLQMQTLVTGSEFLKHLTQVVQHPKSPLVAFSVEIDQQLPFAPVTLGPVATKPVGELGQPTDTCTWSLGDRNEIRCRGSLWRDTSQRLPSWDTSKLVDSLGSVVESFVRADLRDANSRIVSLQHPTTSGVADATLQRLVEVYGGAGVVFCDLDKFKAVNDTLGMPKGDEVILHVSAVIANTVAKSGILVHRSGDEFTLLLPRPHPDEHLLLVRDVMMAVKGHDFGVGNIPVGISAGVTVVTKEGSPIISYKEAEQLAEKTVKLEGGDKLRGKARIRSSGPISSIPAASHQARAVAVCVVKGDPGSERPFDSPWLNLTSRVAYEVCRESGCNCEKVRDEVAELIAWMQPDCDGSILRASLPFSANGDWAPKLSPADLAFAVAHGLFRAGLSLANEALAGKSLRVEYAATNGGACRLLLMPEGHELLRVGAQQQEFVGCDLGGFLSFGAPDRVDLRAARRALLIKIGHAMPSLPDSIFSDVLVVDDRPTRGGMLPDFWESAVARLASRMVTNPNIAWVYVLGKQEYGEETVGRLKNLGRWTDEAEHFSYKTGMSIATIKDAAQRLSGKVAFVTSNDDLVSRFAHDLLSAATVPPLRQRMERPVSTRFLDRELRMEHLSLKIADGCRVATIAEAFPVVLEIARKMPRDQTIRDQAGQELVELIDFRVHLTNPLANRVPAFYAKEDASLEQYLHRAFLDAESFFEARIGKTQRHAVLEHVVMAIRDPTHQFATRRAVLVVPHEIRPREEITPLGLIAVRIIPRFQGRRIVLHFSFTWRTVEALVGFPYSLYGSVGYAEYLTSTIRQMIGEPTARHVEFGEVSYIANSLHMFMDDYGQNIARRIVDDASL